MKSFESGRFNPFPDFPYRDASFPHQSPVHQQIDGGCLPVAYMKGKQMTLPATPVYFGFEKGIPPEVIHIHGNAQPGRIQFLSQVIRLGQGIDGRPCIGIHRMEGFNGKFHPGCCCIRKYCGNAILYLLS